jgi:DNA-binding NarL/FixJ family response regulator
MTLQSSPLASQRAGSSFFPSPLYAPDPGMGSAAASAARVLVVEDDHIVSMDIEHTLTEAGFVVVGIAASAAQALALAHAERPDLALMDIRLLGQRDGIDAAMDIFKETGIRCIFATAHCDAATRDRAQAAQPLGWLSKPYAPGALVQTVRDALSRFSAT